MFSQNILDNLESLGLDSQSWQTLRLAVFAKILFADNKYDADSEGNAWRLEKAKLQSENKNFGGKVFHDALSREKAIETLVSILNAIPLPESKDFKSNLANDIKNFIPDISDELTTLQEIILLSDSIGIAKDVVLGDFIDIWKSIPENTLREENFTATSVSMKNKSGIKPPPKTADKEDCQHFIGLENALKEYRLQKCLLDEEYKKLHNNYTAKCKDISEIHLQDSEIISLFNDALDIIKSEYSMTPGAFNGKNNLHELINYSKGKLLSDQGLLYIPKGCLPSQVYFVGDLHGDLNSLDAVLKKTQFENQKDVALVFLGDYGDRDIRSLRVLTKLLRLKVCYPNRIYLLRGNHEDLKLQERSVSSATTDYDYADSINQLQYISSINVPQTIYYIFEHLPSIILFEDGLVATHGFIPPNVETDLEMRGKPTDQQRELMQIDSIQDLLKRNLQRQIRWQRFQGKKELIFVWPSNYGESDYSDWGSFKNRLGFEMIIRGHDHPKEGYLVYEGMPDILTLCSSHSMDYDSWRCTPAIAKYSSSKRLPESIFLNS